MSDSRKELEKKELESPRTLSITTKSEKKPEKKTILNMDKQKNPRIDFLDLEKPKKKFADAKDTTSHLIASLRSNYDSFVTSKRTHDPAFFGVARVALPPMRTDSPFKCMEPFIQAAKEFLGGNLQEEAVTELLELEKKLNQRYTQLKTEALIKGDVYNEAEAREQILLEILIAFEKKSGFSEAVTIAKDAGPKKDGLITPGEFNKLVFAAHPFLDYGATTQHGPHSHRVQWYLLSQFFSKNDPIFFNDSNIKAIRALITQFKILPSITATELTDAFIRSQFISILYRMFGIPDFNKSFEWEKFRVDLKAKYDEINPGRQVPKEMSPPHVWPQLFDNRGYDGSFTVPSGFGFVQNRGAFSSMPTLGRPNISGDNASNSLKTILDLTKPIAPDIITGTQKKMDYLDPAVAKGLPTEITSASSRSPTSVMDDKHFVVKQKPINSNTPIGKNTSAIFTPPTSPPQPSSSGTTVSNSSSTLSTTP